MIPSYDKCVLLIPGNGVNNGTTFLDYSPYHTSVLASGDTKTSTAQYKHSTYGSSAYFDGSGDFLTVASTERFNLGGGLSWTIGAWIRPDAVSGAWRTIISRRTNGATSWWLGLGPTSLKPEFYNGGPSVGGTGSVQILTSTWQHVKVVYDSVTRLTKIYVDSTEAFSVLDYNARSDADGTPVHVGGWGTVGSNEPFYGYIQDIYVFLGVALHNAVFAPPSALTSFISNSSTTAVLDDTGAPASGRTVIAVPRTYGAQTAFHGLTDTSGRFSLQVPNVEHDVIICDDATGTQYADKFISPVIPV